MVENPNNIEASPSGAGNITSNLFEDSYLNGGQPQHDFSSANLLLARADGNNPFEVDLKLAQQSGTDKASSGESSEDKEAAQKRFRLFTEGREKDYEPSVSPNELRSKPAAIEKAAPGGRAATKDGHTPAKGGRPATKDGTAALPKRREITTIPPKEPVVKPTETLAQKRAEFKAKGPLQYGIKDYVAARDKALELKLPLVIVVRGPNDSALEGFEQFKKANKGKVVFLEGTSREGQQVEGGMQKIAKDLNFSITTGQRTPHIIAFKNLSSDPFDARPPFKPNFLKTLATKIGLSSDQKPGPKPRPKPGPGPRPKPRP